MPHAIIFLQKKRDYFIMYQSIIHFRFENKKKQVEYNLPCFWSLNLTSQEYFEDILSKIFHEISYALF